MPAWAGQTPQRGDRRPVSHKRRSWFRNVAEYATVRALEYTFAAMPIRMALGLGRALGLYIRLWDRRHRTVAEANAARALGLGPDEARAFVRRVYKNLGATFIEGLIIPHILRRRDLSDFCHMEGQEHVRAALDQGRGALLLTAHMGNWELGGFVAAQFAGSILVVARPMDNPLLERNAQRLRQRMNQTVVGRSRGALRAVVKRLREGGLVGMLIDQNHRQNPAFVPFFGKLAATVPSPASIALKYDVPVLPGYAWRDPKRFLHHFHCDPPFELIRTGDHKADVVANTAMFTRRIEEYVLRHPEQWLWLHQRWRKRPPEEREATTAEPAAADDRMPERSAQPRRVP